MSCFIKNELSLSLKLVRIYKEYTNRPERGPTAFNYRFFDNRFDHHLQEQERPVDRTVTSKLSSQRGIYYAAASSCSSIDMLHCCLAERFPSIPKQILREIETNEKRNTPLKIAFCSIEKTVTVIDLRGDCPSFLGIPKEIISTGNRPISQKFSRELYERTPPIDGIIYPSFQLRNILGAKYMRGHPIRFSAIALYERAESSLVCDGSYPLADFKPEINDFIESYFL